MIQQTIAEKIKGLITFTDFTAEDRIGGLVKTIENGNLNSGLPSKYPAYLPPTAAAGESYLDMIPSDNHRCVFYVEDWGARALLGATFPDTYEATFRIIGWLNTALFPGIDSAYIQARILERLFQRDLRLDEYITQIDMTPTRLYGHEQNLFSRYSYNESYKQFLMHPYSAFGIELSVKYVLNYACITIGDWLFEAPVVTDPVVTDPEPTPTEPTPLTIEKTTVMNSDLVLANDTIMN